MPTYLVTDSTGPHEIMVEASRPAAALAAVVDNRFSVSEALGTAEGIRLAQKGVRFLDITTESEPVAKAPATIKFDATGDPIIDDEPIIFRRRSGLWTRPSFDDEGSEHA